MAKRFATRALLLFSSAALVFAALLVGAAQEPAAIPVESEAHHHVVLENAYVRVLFVEIPPHEATLFHHHDLPYVSVPPGGADAMPPRLDAAPASSAPYVPRVGYSAGNFSHAVTNSSDAPMRNVAIELLKPQGMVRNRCAAIVPNQPTDTCEQKTVDPSNPPKRTPLLETDEILIQSLELGPNSKIAPADSRFDSLICGVSGVVTALGSEGAPDDPALWVRGGLLWLAARSKTVFTIGPSGGHFIAITFKDTTRLPDRE
jgi:hypothetical protein